MIFPPTQDVTEAEYTIESLNKARGLVYGYYNIRGLITKLDAIKLILTRSKIHVLALSETFLTDKIDDSELTIPGYKFYRWDRTAESGKTRGGGLLTYVSLKYDFTLVEGSVTCSKDVESGWLKLSLKRACPTYLCIFYRPPDGDIQLTLDNIENGFYEYEERPDSDIVCLGDMNIDLLTPSCGKSKLLTTLK